MNAKGLREEFEKDLKWLQDNCKHEKSQLMEYQYVPGHFGGMVMVCDRCEKILESMDANHSQAKL